VPGGGSGLGLGPGARLTRPHQWDSVSPFRPKKPIAHSGAQWSKITPGIAGLAAGSHARRPAPALNEFRKFRKTMPRPRPRRPRRGSKLVFGGPRAAKSSLRCIDTPLTTGDPHVSRMSAWSLAWPLCQKSPLRRDVAFSPPSTLPAQSGACIHNWTSREPVFAAGKEDMLDVRAATKQGPDSAQAYLPLNRLLALRSEI
jgi:hypothetical protein